jgi:hypothetical protein
VASSLIIVIHFKHLGEPREGVLDILQNLIGGDSGQKYLLGHNVLRARVVRTSMISSLEKPLVLLGAFPETSGAVTFTSSR